MKNDTLLEVLVDDLKVQVRPGLTVAALLLGLGRASRRSVRGEARAPLCGMGTCFECRVEIDGVPHQRSCLVACEDGMEVRTGGD